MFQKINIKDINKFLFYVLIFVSIFFVIAARRPDILLHSELWAEDGRYWLADAYNNGFESIFSPQNGYYQTVSRLTFNIVILFGLSKAALLANIVAIFIRVCFVMFCLSSRISFIPISYRIIAMIYFLFMPNITESYVNITNAQWYLSLYLFMIIFADASVKFIWKLHDIIILVIAGLSGPFVIFLLPCLFIKHVAQRKNIVQVIKNINAFDMIILICCIIQICIIILTVGVNTRSSAPLGASFVLFVKIISARIFIGTFLSTHLVNVIEANGYFSFLEGWFKYCLFFVFIFIVYKKFFSSGWRFWISLLFPVFIISFALVMPMVSFVSQQWPLFLKQGTAERYFIITNYAFFCFVLYLISYMGKFTQSALYSLMICMIPLFFINFSMPPLAHLGFQESINKFNKLNKRQAMSIMINPSGWSMDLKKK